MIYRSSFKGGPGDRGYITLIYGFNLYMSAEKIISLPKFNVNFELKTIKKDYDIYTCNKTISQQDRRLTIKLSCFL